MVQSTDPDIIRVIDKINQLGLKKKAVAHKAGITAVYLSYILNGTRKLTPDIKDKLFSVLEIS